MSSRTGRVALRVTVIAVQWVALTVGVGSLVMRSDTSFSQLISPTVGIAPLFIAAVAAGFMLGMTIESPKVAVPLTLLMCLGAASFVGVLSHAPVVDGVLLRTTALDNYVMQRVLLITLIMGISSMPAVIVGNLVGGRLNIRQEIAPHPEDLERDEEVPWWEKRHDGKTDTEAGRHPA
jgi:hypothetical protein